ncbi:hypothetical protein B0H17DRAFT_77181 [Mycena rosella]|uniref:Uncharacterized protein n=1 Tax=Mycena rosella TaxID=1033263 RepID=A0AAD7D5T6_MYCRO|nr:hypothetical protein B0H17DRAFT_77181 [Mycena rosella]
MPAPHPSKNHSTHSAPPAVSRGQPTHHDGFASSASSPYRPSYNRSHTKRSAKSRPPAPASCFRFLPPIPFTWSLPLDGVACRGRSSSGNAGSPPTTPQADHESCTRSTYAATSARPAPSACGSPARRICSVTQCAGNACAGAKSGFCCPYTSAANERAENLACPIRPHRPRFASNPNRA